MGDKLGLKALVPYMRPGDTVRISRGLYHGLVGVLGRIRGDVVTVRLWAADLNARHTTPLDWFVDEDGRVAMGFSLIHVQPIKDTP